MPFPAFDPVLVQLGPFAIRWYALAYVAGILIGWRYMVGMIRNPRLWARRPPPISEPQIDDMVLWLTLGVIVGGRLGHVVFYTPSMIWTDPLQILMVWRGGMSFHGGLIGVLTAVGLFTWRNRLDALRVGDLIAASTPIGLFFGRLANFINGELWGRPTNLPWGIVFPNAPDAAPRHPSQLYEAALEGLALFLILRWATHGAKLTNRRGAVVGLFALFYGLFRISLENVRQPDQGLDNFPLGLTMGMILSAPMVVAGLWLIVRALREPAPLPDDEPS